jgi:hypothetical protein
MAELFMLWRNPVFQRFCRARLRLRKSIFWLLLTLVVTTFVVAMTFIVRTKNMGVPEEDAARWLWLPLLIIQGVVLLIKGTGSVSAGLIQDKIDQTLDYQRLTPMTPIHNLLGYLFGLPIMEYAMFALTLPHLAFVVAVGNIPLSVVGSVYLVFFSCAILYHVSGIAVGMVMKRWILGYVLSVLTVLLLNIVLPTFISQLGLKFLQYLSMWPVIGQKFLPLVVRPEVLSQIAAQNAFFSMADAVPFFNWTLSPFLFTLILQSALTVTFAKMALRRWQSLTRHSLSKRYALAVLGGFVVLFMGNLWPAISGQYMPFPLFGTTNLDVLGEGLAVGLPLVYCLVVWVLCFVLLSIVVPTHHAYARGVTRAAKLGRSAAAVWDDDASGLPFVGLLAAIAMAGFGILFFEMSASGFFDFVLAPGALWRLPAALALVIVYTGLLLQVVELRLTVLVILLLWCCPLLLAAVMSAAADGVNTLQAVIGALSPIALLATAGMLTLNGAVPTDAANEFAVMLTAFQAGSFFIAIQIAGLSWLWLRSRRIVHTSVPRRK